MFIGPRMTLKLFRAFVFDAVAICKYLFGSRRHVDTRSLLVRAGAMLQTSIGLSFIDILSEQVKKGAFPPRHECRGFHAMAR